jgi:hypothetical protein
MAFLLPFAPGTFGALPSSYADANLAGYTTT